MRLLVCIPAAHSYTITTIYGNSFFCSFHHWYRKLVRAHSVPKCSVRKNVSGQQCICFFGIQVHLSLKRSYVRRRTCMGFMVQAYTCRQSCAPRFLYQSGSKLLRLKVVEMVELYHCWTVRVLSLNNILVPPKTSSLKGRLRFWWHRRAGTGLSECHCRLTTPWRRATTPLRRRSSIGAKAVKEGPWYITIFWFWNLGDARIRIDLWEARSRLYRRRFLQLLNTCVALLQLYTIYALVHRSKRVWNKPRCLQGGQHFFENEQPLQIIGGIILLITNICSRPKHHQIHF